MTSGRQLDCKMCLGAYPPEIRRRNVVRLRTREFGTWGRHCMKPLACWGGLDTRWPRHEGRCKDMEMQKRVRGIKMRGLRDRVDGL